MTEGAHQMASNPLPPGVAQPGSVGRAAGPEIAVLDDAGSPVASGEIGEVAIRGANVTAGYLQHARGQRGRVHGRRLAAHRRPGTARRRRLPLTLAGRRRRSSTAAARRSRPARSTRRCCAIRPWPQAVTFASRTKLGEAGRRCRRAAARGPVVRRKTCGSSCRSAWRRTRCRGGSSPSTRCPRARPGSRSASAWPSDSA